MALVIGASERLGSALSEGPSRHHVYEYDDWGTLLRELLYEDNVLSSSLEYRFT